MKSKTSFFNKTLFLKNITLFWPIWALYTFIIMIYVDGSLFFGFRHNNLWNNYELTKMQEIDNQIRVLNGATSITTLIVVVSIAALVVGMALFNYLYTSKSANMLHSLPITRVQHFGTNLISGLVMLWVPQIIAFLIGVLICLSYGVTYINIMGIWLLSALAIAFIIYSMVVFCAFLTGQLFALPIYFVALNFLYLFVRTLILSFETIVSYGVSPIDLMYGYDDKLSCLSPLYYLVSKIEFEPVQKYKNDEYFFTGMSFHGTNVLLIYIAVAVVFLAVAFYFYKKRNIENAGDAITVGFVKPIFKWGVGSCFGYGGGMLIYEILSEIDINVKRTGLFILCLVVGVLCYFFAQMYLDKSFKVFNGRKIRRCGVFAAFMLVIFVSLNLYTSKQEKYIPDIDLVEDAVISSTYSIAYEGDEITKVIDVHKDIVKEIKNFRDNDNYAFSVSIYYKMKNGKIVKRNYAIPVSDKGKELYDTICEEEAKYDNLKTYIFGKYHNDSIEIMDGNFQRYDEEYSHDNSVEFTKAEAEKLTEAILLDAEEGNLQKYISYGYEARAVERYAAEVCINFKVTDLKDYISPDQIRWSDYYENSTWYDYPYGEEYFNTYVEFGKDCQHIINTLIELGAIESADELESME